MGALSTYAAAGLNNLTMRGDTFASPATVYLGFFVTPPAADGSATEMSGGGYVRKAITFTDPDGGQIEQDTAVTWTALHSGADQMIAGWGIWDAATAGNLLAYGRTPSYRVRMGGGFTAPAGAIAIASNGAAMSNYLADAWLAHLFRNDAYSAPSNVYIGHYTVTPTATTAGTEVSDTDYDRQVSDWDTAGVLDNTPTWAPLATEDDQTLTGWAVLDAATAGNVLRFAAWDTPIEYVAGDTLEMTAGSATFRAL
jgi:hypothetical protein